AGAGYLASGPGYLFALTPAAVTLTLRKPIAQEGVRRTSLFNAALTRRRRSFFHRAQAQSAPLTMRLRLVGANPRAAAFTSGELPGGITYASVAPAAVLHTDIAAFARVGYLGVHPGIDLIYHGNDHGRVEYDFRVAPGADASLIRLGFEGVDTLEVDRGGDLV